MCLQERLYEKSTIVESEGQIYRLDLSSVNLINLRAFTPIIFSTRYVSGKPLSGNTPTFVGQFSSVYVDGQDGDLHPHEVQGCFEANGPAKLTFVWNPLNIFRTPIRLTTMKYLGMPLDVEMGVSFSIRPPVEGRDFAYPFVKKYSLSDRQRDLLDEATCNFFPPTFLEDLRDSPVFSVHIAIGIPENSVVPTLSYSDFSALSSVNSVNWQNIKKYVSDKYEKRSKGGDEVALRFVKALTEHKANLDGSHSILVAPGFWQKFANARDGMNLAQSILSSSNFKVFLLVTGHSASNGFNAQEFNPHIMGKGLDKEVAAIFVPPLSVSGCMWEKNYVLTWSRICGAFFLWL